MKRRAMKVELDGLTDAFHANTFIIIYFIF